MKSTSKWFKQFLYTLYLTYEHSNSDMIKLLFFINLLCSQGTKMQFMRLARSTVFETEPRYNSDLWDSKLAP